MSTDFILCKLQAFHIIKFEKRYIEVEKNEYTAKYNEYSQLLDATYSQAVAYLLNKYGAVTDDYYKEKIIHVIFKWRNQKYFKRKIL